MPPVSCTPPETGRELVKRWKKMMAFTPDIDERAAILDIAGQPRRLRLFYVLRKSCVARQRECEMMPWSAEWRAVAWDAVAPARYDGGVDPMSWRLRSR